MGAAKVMCKPKPPGDPLVEWYEAVELECDFPFDDFRDNPDGKQGVLSEGKGAWNPGHFIENLPDTVVKVYRVDPLSITSQLIGYWKGPTKSVLIGVGDPFADWTDVTYVGTLADENGTAGLMEGIQPIVIPPGDVAPLPSKKAPFGDPEDTVTQKIMNPYKGFQMRELSRDASCSLDPDQHAGFIAFSAKLWMPDRYKCAHGPPKGPPVLSPWKEWNKLPIPKPNMHPLNWVAGFQIRAHIYQAKNLQARNDTGVTSSYFVCTYGQYPPQKTHVVALTNNPTFDTTLILPDLEMVMLPNMLEMTSVSWGGVDDYMVNAEDAGEVEDNMSMLRIAPRFELACWESGPGGKDKLLGRIFVGPETVLTRKANPEWWTMFRGDPNVAYGEVLCVFQVIKAEEKIMREPPMALIPDISQVTKETPCNKAPLKAIQMIESKIQVQILGLRSLEDPSPIPGVEFLANPSIEISCDDPKTCVATKPARPPANDANFMECLEIAVLLPKEAKFAPTIDFFVYDNQPILTFMDRVLTAYGSVDVADYYVDESELMGGDDEEEESEDAKAKRLEAEKKKKFLDMTKDLQKELVINVKGRKTLERFYLKKDEAVFKAFDQYLDAPEPELFRNRIIEFLGGSSAAEAAAKLKAKEEETKQKKEQAEKAKKELEDREKKRKEKEAAEKAANGEDGEEEEADGEDEAGADAGTGVADAPDAGDDDTEDADAQESEGEAPGEDQDADCLLEDDDIPPDFQEEVDTADGKPNPEWMLLRAHPYYEMPLEQEPSKWKPLFDTSFDEVKLFRGQIKNEKQKEAEVVGIIKCKIKVFQLEEISPADEAKGIEAKFLDMAELKEGRRMEYEMPDIYENFPARNLEIRATMQ